MLCTTAAAVALFAAFAPAWVGSIATAIPDAAATGNVAWGADARLIVWILAWVGHAPDVSRLAAHLLGHTAETLRFAKALFEVRFRLVDLNHRPVWRFHRQRYVPLRMRADGEAPATHVGDHFPCDRQRHVVKAVADAQFKAGHQAPDVRLRQAR